MKKAILFDLGNTLARYYELKEFPGILERGIIEVENYLRPLGLEIAGDELRRRVAAENHEASDHSVRPLEERLARIFGERWSREIVMEMCGRFMRPIFALSSLYDDVLPALGDLRSRGYRIAIISNTPWGSPANLWHEEIERLGLSDRIDAAIFCRDAGWRKPATQVFRHALDILSLTPADCIFVGDDPRWDIIGPQSIGMEAILIDRINTGSMHTTANVDMPSLIIRELTELPRLL